MTTTAGANIAADYAAPDPGGATAVVIMGASGNLTQTKLAPALFNLYRKGRLPRDVRVIGVAREPWDDAEFRNRLRPGVADASVEEWDEFTARVCYVAADVTDAAGLAGVYRRIADLAPDEDANLDCLYYLALAPGSLPTHHRHAVRGRHG